MTIEDLRIELRIRKFDRAFPHCARRETWLTMYLDLREKGHSHDLAIETIRKEMPRLIVN